MPGIYYANEGIAVEEENNSGCDARYKLFWAFPVASAAEELNHFIGRVIWWLKIVWVRKNVAA